MCALDRIFCLHRKGVMLTRCLNFINGHAKLTNMTENPSVSCRAKWAVKNVIRSIFLHRTPTQKLAAAPSEAGSLTSHSQTPNSLQTLEKTLILDSDITIK